MNERKDNLIQLKSYEFSLQIIKLYKLMIEKKNVFELAKQILRSGTSIGANVEEAIGAQSKKDFFAKISVAYKESRETQYWIRLLSDSGYLTKGSADLLLGRCEELSKILSKIQLSTKKSIIAHS